MPSNILEDARLFLLEYFRGRPNPFESRHPWRRDWEFAVLHTLRVESYVTRILAREDHPLSAGEVNLLHLAAILHDIGRLEKREEHARLGAEIANKWLTESSNHRLSREEVERVVGMIADHSDKSGPESDYARAVLKDADTLDEIGMMSVFMAANWVDKQSPFFFHQLRQRLIEAEIPFCEGKLGILNTQGARDILQEKKAFLENFIVQINDELQMDPLIEGMLLTNSR